MRYDDTDSPILSTKFTKKPVVYLLNSTSNHNVLYAITALAALYIFWILHQTTTYLLRCMRPLSCISFESYIKPQLGLEKDRQRTVVYLLNPTSNHNQSALFAAQRSVVYLLTPTSNHNCACCLLISEIVVYLLTPTSNHNALPYSSYLCMLYIFWLLHQTTTSTFGKYFLVSCISFDSYIKPQHISIPPEKLYVVYLLTPTSNHNHLLIIHHTPELYIFWLLHQTTTWHLP